MPAQITRPGSVGVVSRSGTLTYEAVDQLSRLGIGIGQPSCVGIGGDPVIGADGVGRLDVRAAIETHDGANIYVSYTGVLHMTENVVQALSGGRLTEFGETYFYVSPRFETGDPRYAWLNGLFVLSQGRVGPLRVEYRVFEVR